MTLTASDLEELDELTTGTPYVPGRCLNVLGIDDETGEEIVCGDDCNPSEQLCHACRMYPGRSGMTWV